MQHLEKIGLKSMGFNFAFLILLSILGTTKLFDFKFQQSDYKLTFERIELVRFNKQYVKSFKIATFKYNRTTPLTNLTYEYNIDVGNSVEIVSQAYVFLSNEYRLFPLRLEINWCEGISKNYIGLATVMKCGNFTGCPEKKGVSYHVCNWTPDESQFPPLIPNGNYMLEIQGVFHDIEIFVMRGYGTIYRPIGYKG